MRKTMSNLISH